MFIAKFMQLVIPLGIMYFIILYIIDNPENYIVGASVPIAILAILSFYAGWLLREIKGVK